MKSSTNQWTSERAARIALSCTVEPGDLALAERLLTQPSEVAWAAVCAGKLGPASAERAARFDGARMRRQTELLRVRFIVPGDPEWPEGLADLEQAVLAERTGGVPVGLWLKGPASLAVLARRAVAVVGARACTAYGEGVAADLATGLADHDVTVVSGGAYGIDAAAHRGALAAGGATLAVLACGVDVPYPRGNAALLNRMGREHLLVSELAPGAHPTRSRFLTRNRLIAALSGGTVVVEAALRSGARNTAGWAARCGRPLMAVPGPVHSALSEAPHLMIREQQATLVTSAAEVLELVSPIGHHTLVPQRGEVRDTDRLTPDQLALVDALPARRAATTDEVALASGLATAACLVELATLEELGFVVAEARGWRRAWSSS